MLLLGFPKSKSIFLNSGLTMAINRAFNMWQSVLTKEVLQQCIAHAEGEREHIIVFLEWEEEMDKQMKH